jgi:hypothetical protein
MSQLLLNTPDKRRGSFEVSIGRGAGLTVDEAQAIFADFIPMHIESYLHAGKAVYYGVSPHFSPVEFGARVPEYRAILVRDDSGELVRVHWLREGEREPVQYLQEPDWDAVRNAVEKVIRRHDIELKVEARRKAEEAEQLEQERHGAAMKALMDRDRERQQAIGDRLNGMCFMFGLAWPHVAGLSGVHPPVSHFGMSAGAGSFGSWDPAAYR